ncbi:uncharacterized protein N7458_006185 [Penicillium daleae]|uniref:Uncharacterized protein n=1 Tax=Penicillium daleae TaxID=63821 RepID=A0AAD6C5N2_9EURO|nr:uncharacterized protein N7458_006185 [Penicillium daleae]KAJ5449736.1 hypothetical protein N7458_006185 [Penicillium daleae]
MATKSKPEEDQPVENIIIAADHGRLDLVTTLLESGADPNTVDEVGTSALHNAAKRGHWHIARLLLEKNASPSIQDGNDAIPLHLAIRAGHKQIVRVLLDYDPSTCNFKENGRNEPLYIAAVFGHADIVQNLLDCGATTLAPSGDETALHLAARKGHHDVHAKDYTGNTPFAYAVEKGHERAVDVFLRHYPELGKTCNGHKNLLFHRAIEMRKVEMVRIFSSHGTDVEMKDSSGQRALHRAVGTENTELIQLILEYGPVIDAKENYGFTPSQTTRDPKIRMLLRNHANTHAKGPSLPVAPTTAAPPPEYKA